MLDWLHPTQIIYCDTDSVIFLVDEDDKNHTKLNDPKPEGLELGTNLGQWANELDNDDYITEIVCGGAKSNSYKTFKGKYSLRQKGITMNRSNEDVVNFESMKNMVLNNSTIKSSPIMKFNWDNKTKDMTTSYVARRINRTIETKRDLIDCTSYPVGYERA
jgi:hypothetical protein